MALSGNRGEWSEIYALFKLLGEGVVYAGNGDMERIDSLFYPIIRIIRDEEGVNEYAPNFNSERNVLITHDGEEFARIPMESFSQEAARLLRMIKDAEGAAFSLPSVEEFMNSINCHVLKAPSLDKSDIRIVIHDLRTGMSPRLGFSIKSQLGEPATLMNAVKATNITYRIEGALTDNDKEQINSIPKQGRRMKALFDKGCSISFHSMNSETFEDNLIIIDSLLPLVFAETLKEHYLSDLSSLRAITEALAERNPLNVRKPQQYYAAKIKALLIDAALGMTPATPWERKYDANGGYLVVKEDGDVICYHFYDKNQLEDYLFSNTRFDFPSRTRFGYGSIYEEGGEYFIKLNCQIRFR